MIQGDKSGRGWSGGRRKGGGGGKGLDWKSGRDYMGEKRPTRPPPASLNEPFRTMGRTGVVKHKFEVLDIHPHINFSNFQRCVAS